MNPPLRPARPHPPACHRRPHFPGIGPRTGGRAVLRGHHRNVSLPQRQAAGSAAMPEIFLHEEGRGAPPYTRRQGSLRREPHRPSQQRALGGRPGHLRRAPRACSSPRCRRPSRGARDASAGGLVFHDVTTLRHAEKALEAGVDGLILVASGAGGHAGRVNPIALVNEIRAFCDGPLALSGCISHGKDIPGRSGAGLRFRLHGHALHRHAGIAGGRRLPRWCCGAGRRRGLHPLFLRRACQLPVGQHPGRVDPAAL